MKQLFSFSIAALVTFMGTTVGLSDAFDISEGKLDRHCRGKLRIRDRVTVIDGKKETYTPLLFQLRRCKTLLRKQLEHQMAFERRLQRLDQHFWRRWEFGQNIKRQSRRSLVRQIEQRQRERRLVYRSYPPKKRVTFLRQMKARQRELVYKRERELVQKRRAERKHLAAAKEFCRYTILGTERRNCIQERLLDIQ